MSAWHLGNRHHHQARIVLRLGPHWEGTHWFAIALRLGPHWEGCSHYPRHCGKEGLAKVPTTEITTAHDQIWNGVDTKHTCPAGRTRAPAGAAPVAADQPPKPQPLESSTTGRAEHAKNEVTQGAGDTRDTFKIIHTANSYK